MNIANTDTIVMIARTCSCKARVRKVTYAFVDQFYTICLDKKDILQAELEACEKLLKYSRDKIDRCAIESEIGELKTALDLMS